MGKHRDPYAELRKDQFGYKDIIEAFHDDKPIDRHMWHVRRLPGGSRVLYHGAEPTMLYDGNADKYYLRINSTIVANTSDRVLWYTAHGGHFLRVSEEKFWEVFNELMFTERLRKGGKHDLHE